MNVRFRRWLAVGFAAGVVIFVQGPAEALSPDATEEDRADGRRIFERRCVSCHTIGRGVRVGPDLRDVHKRRDRAWLLRWIADPEGMSANDPEGQKLLSEWKPVGIMPHFDLSEKEITQVVAYLEKESAEPARPAGERRPPTALSPVATKEDRADGRRIFERRCVSCHTIGRGVRVGPDLRDVHKRRDRAWLLRWIADPEGMSASDPEGQKLLSEWKPVGIMPHLDLTETEITQVLSYLEEESAERARPASARSTPAALSQ